MNKYLSWLLLSFLAVGWNLAVAPVWGWGFADLVLAFLLILTLTYEASLALVWLVFSGWWLDLLSPYAFGVNLLSLLTVYCLLSLARGKTRAGALMISLSAFAFSLLHELAQVAFSELGRFWEVEAVVSSPARLVSLDLLGKIVFVTLVVLLAYLLLKPKRTFEKLLSLRNRRILSEKSTRGGRLSGG